MLHKITTLVGGPLDGQEFSETFFDGRAHINVWPKPEPVDPNAPPKLPDRLTESNMHTYYLNIGQIDDDNQYALFAYEGVTTEEINEAAARLTQAQAPASE